LLKIPWRSLKILALAGKDTSDLGFWEAYTRESLIFFLSSRSDYNKNAWYRERLSRAQYQRYITQIAVSII
jgi:hypothetical protein